MQIFSKKRDIRQPQGVGLHSNMGGCRRGRLDLCRRGLRVGTRKRYTYLGGEIQWRHVAACDVGQDIPRRTDSGGEGAISIATADDVKQLDLSPHNTLEGIDRTDQFGGEVVAYLGLGVAEVGL